MGNSFREQHDKAIWYVTKKAKYSYNLDTYCTCEHKTKCESECRPKNHLLTLVGDICLYRLKHYVKFH